MFGLMIAQRPLKVRERIQSGNRLLAGVYEIYGIGGGGGGKQIPTWTTGRTNSWGDRGLQGNTFGPVSLFIGVQQYGPNAVVIGAGGSIVNPDQPGATGGNTGMLRRDGFFGVLFSGGSGGQSDSIINDSNRVAGPSTYVFDDTAGKGGDGAISTFSLSQSATNGAAGRMDAVKVA